MDKTKLNMNNQHHQMLVGILSMFVDDFGYTTRELFALMDDSKNQLWHGLTEIEREKSRK